MERIQEIRYLTKNDKGFSLEDINENILRQRKSFIFKGYTTTHIIDTFNNKIFELYIDLGRVPYGVDKIYIIKIKEKGGEILVNKTIENPTLSKLRTYLKEKMLKFGFKDNRKEGLKDIQIESLDLEEDLKKEKALTSLKKEKREQELNKKVLDFLENDIKGITSEKEITKGKFTLKYVKGYNSVKYIFSIKRGKNIDYFYGKNISDIYSYFSEANKKVEKDIEKKINTFLLKETKGITSSGKIETQIEGFYIDVLYDRSRYETLKYSLVISTYSEDDKDSILAQGNISNRKLVAKYKGEGVIDLINYKKS